MNTTSPQQEGTQFIVIFILSIALMVTDHYSQLMSSVRNVLLTALDPVERAATAPKEIYDWVSQDFTTLNQLTADKNRLETENLLLRAELQQLNKLKIDVAQLNRLLGTASKVPQNTSKIASVTGYSDSPISHFCTLNEGALAGLEVNLPVIDPSGIMGKIISITPASSRVLLITDPDSQIPVRIQRTGQRGVLTGTGTEKLLLQFIPNSSSILIGDIIETTGLGDLYPEGYPVASVASLNKREDQPYYEIEAEATAQLNISTKVLILTKEQDTLAEKTE